jgi:hypothetical protein
LSVRNTMATQFLSRVERIGRIETSFNDIGPGSYGDKNLMGGSIPGFIPFNTSDSKLYFLHKYSVDPCTIL